MIFNVVNTSIIGLIVLSFVILINAIRHHIKYTRERRERQLDMLKTWDEYDKKQKENEL